MSLRSRAAGKLRRGDQVVCTPFGTHTVETLEQLPGGAVRVELTEAIILVAAATHEITIVEAAA